MRISFHRNFEKQYKKLNGKLKAHTKARLALFLDDPFHPVLNNHALKGKYLDYRSINITGDIRALFKYKNTDECIFVMIDTHSNLYS